MGWFYIYKNNGELWGFGVIGRTISCRPKSTNTKYNEYNDINGDDLGGINSVDNISEANTLRIVGNIKQMYLHLMV